MQQTSINHIVVCLFQTQKGTCKVDLVLLMWDYVLLQRTFQKSVDLAEQSQFLSSFTFYSNKQKRDVNRQIFYKGEMHI